MRGLTDEERYHVEMAMRPMEMQIEMCTDEEVRTIDRLVARGLIVWETNPWDEDYEVAMATPVGRLAYRLDTAARTGTLVDA